MAPMELRAGAPEAQPAGQGIDAAPTLRGPPEHPTGPSCRVPAASLLLCRSRSPRHRARKNRPPLSLAHFD
eukprot:4373005-Pyramimonas_sp.AAC.1